MKTSKILKAINNFSELDLIELNNIYCDSINAPDSQIFGNDEDFFATFYPNPGDGIKVAQAIFYGDYNYSHEYVKFNGYGNLQSISYFEIKDLCEFPEVIAEYVAENFNEFEHLFS